MLPFLTYVRLNQNKLVGMSHIEYYVILITVIDIGTFPVLNVTLPTKLKRLVLTNNSLSGEQYPLLNLNFNYS